MLTKKRIALATLFGVFILAITIFFIAKPNQNDIDKAAIRGHLDKIHSLSGKLTETEKQVFFDNFFALEKYELTPDEEITDFLTPEEQTRIQEHVQALIRENPDLELPPHSHAHGQGHEHAYQKHAEKQEELAHINATIEDVKASDAPEGAKNAILNILNHRRGVLMDDGKRAREMDQVLKELMKNEPDVVGLEWDAHGYKRVYAHELHVKKLRRHYPDGTVEEEYAGGSYGSTDSELGPALQKYMKELENTPPSEKLPEPPQHKDLRYTVEYEDVYLDGAGKEISDPSLETSEPTDNTDDTAETVHTAEPSTETPPELPQEYPESRIIEEEEVSSWQEELRALAAAEHEELRALFEKGVGIPLERFMEMSDAEIEAEFQKQFSISPIETGFEKALEERAMSTQNAPLRPGNDMESSLREKYSTFRFRRAMATLNHHGPEEGIRRLQEIDPEMAADVKKFQQQDRED